MAKTKTRPRPPAKRQVQLPQAKAPARRKDWMVWAAIAPWVVLAAVLGGLWLAKSGAEEPSGAPAAPTVGLPETPDYHSLLVDPTNPRHVWLGTHNGLHESTDGGRTWTDAGLEGQDAMNLARTGSQTVWAAGHLMFAKSADGGVTWSDMEPDGLPSLDIHGFAVDPRDPSRLYAAIANEGLYRSSDRGRSFELVSTEVGPAVMALALTPGGRILAGDMRQGLMASDDGGRTWRRALAAGLMGLALNPADPRRLLATGPGILLSTDGGESWRQVQAIEEGAGPVAWSDPKMAYAVGFDRRLYRTNDGGVSWRPVA